MLQESVPLASCTDLCANSVGSTSIFKLQYRRSALERMESKEVGKKKEKNIGLIAQSVRQKIMVYSFTRVCNKQIT